MKNSVLNVNKKNYGVMYGFIAYTLWGLLPLYWKIIKSVPAYEILAHRIVWSFLFVSLIVFIKGEWRSILTILKDKKCMTYIILCSVLITVNWFIYIWSVNSEHIVDASLGYYINPLMLVFLGLIVLKEKLNLSQVVALSIAAAGVVIMIAVYGRIPWISLALAISFGLYGLCKKMVSAESTTGLVIETMITMPAALVFLIVQGLSGHSAYGSSVSVTILLSLTGIATATPLLFFAESTKLVKLSTIGFLQYLSPTISLILGVFVYKEHFSQVDLVSFSFIWAALIIYSVSILRKSRGAGETAHA